jgi:hypothetical protein
MTTSCSFGSPVHPVADAHRPGLGLRDRRPTIPTSTSCARKRRAGHRLLERDASSRCSDDRWSSSPDYEAYEAERGFYFDYRTGVPGPIFETSEALARYLRAGDFTSNGWIVSGGIVRRRRWTVRVTRHGRADRTRPGGGSDLGALDTSFQRLGVPYRGPPSPASAGHVTGTDPHHDLSCQARRQARPPTSVGDAGPTELLPEPGLRAHRRHRPGDPRHRGRSQLLQRASRVGRQRRWPVDHQDEFTDRPRSRPVSTKRRPGPDLGHRRAPDRAQGTSLESNIAQQRESLPATTLEPSTPSTRRSWRPRKASLRHPRTSMPGSPSRRTPGSATVVIGSRPRRISVPSARRPLRRTRQRPRPRPRSRTSPPARAGKTSRGPSRPTRRPDRRPATSAGCRPTTRDRTRSG